MKKKNEDSLRDFWDSIKCTNTQIIGIPEEEEEEKEIGYEKKYLKRLQSKTFLTWEKK